MTANKYKAKAVFWDDERRRVISKESATSSRKANYNRLPKHIHRFDSTLEFNVYLKLVQIYSPDLIDRQVSLTLFPSGDCYPTGKNWRVDFGIKMYKDSSQYAFLVEAKGLMTKEFNNLLPVLELNNPVAFNALYLVFGSKIPVSNRVIKNLLKTRFKSRIYTLEQFNNLRKPL